MTHAATNGVAMSQDHGDATHISSRANGNGLIKTVMTVKTTANHQSQNFMPTLYLKRPAVCNERSRR